MPNRIDLWKTALPALVVALVACGDAAGPPPENLIDRELFVAVYVDLRVDALNNEGREISDEGRTEILSRHGVTEAQVLGFVEYHGEDLDFMRDVWNDVEILLDAQRPGREEARTDGSEPGLPR